MNQQILGSICEQIYRRFPELAGSRPSVQDRPGDQCMLIFRGSSKTADGHTITNTVRVLVSTAGKIIKVSSSR